MPGFCHLHLHTQYSLLDGMCRIEQAIAASKAMGMPACAITDHGVMYGVIDFYRKAKAEGIKPIIGCEVYVCADRREKSSAAREYAHLVLLCETQEGYQNLIKLCSIGFTEGFYYKPRVDYDTLLAHSKGLIALSACLSGDIPSLLLDGRAGDARKMALRYQEIFGKDNFFIEVQDHGIADEKRVLPELVALARELDIPLVATNDVHYLRKQDAEAQDVLICIQTGKVLADENRMRMHTNEMYFKSAEEMAALFPQCPDALENTVRIAERCDVSFDFDTIHVPQYALPEGETTPEGYLRRLCEEGFLKKYAPDNQQARERLDYELDMIVRMGYVDYFLIVWDFIKFAKDNGILVGPGRGSGAGSIVAYTLNITGIDPLAYQLLFERFLNPERVSMPDLDIDFCYERRQEVIDYVTRKYGQNHVAQIITFGTMAARSAVRDVGRVLGMSYQEVDRIAKLVPFALGITLEKALEASGELRQAVANEPDVKRLYDFALQLEGMPRHASTHAAGVLITGKPVDEYVPLQTNDQVVTTQFPMGTLENLGLLKMDFLGLRTLTVIQDTLDMLEKEGIQLSSDDIPMDDKAPYEMISQGETDGVFQLESGGMRAFLKDMKPGCLEDIVAAVALYRPGPMDSIPRYIQGKQNPDGIAYLHPMLEPILSVTYGCIVYQEQVMQIVRDVGGYSLGRSDLMRRAMSKKKREVMEQEHHYFVHGMQENGQVVVPGAVRKGVPEKVAEEIFHQMSSFAQYAFNKSHAAAYAVIAVQTAYLKHHYPVHFMAALMNSMLGDQDKIAGYLQYCRAHGITVLPPDVNRSNTRFSVEMLEDGKRAVRFGLGAIKNVGSGVTSAIVRARTQKPFEDIFDFCLRLDCDQMNKRALESLIKASAFDGIKTGDGNPVTRSQLLHVYETALDSAAQERKRNISGQISLFDDLEDTILPRPEMPDLPELPERTRLAMEKEMTGVYITGHPLDAYQELLADSDMNIRFIREMAQEEGAEMRYDGMRVDFGGIVVSRRSKMTKSGKMMGIVILEDLYGQIECLLFPKVFDRWMTQLAQDALVMVTAKLSVREEEEPKLLIDSVRPLQLASNASPLSEDALPRPPMISGIVKKLCLRVQDAAHRDAILPLLRENAGVVPVFIHLSDEAKTYRLSLQYGVSEDPWVVDLLSQKLGPENVKLVESPATAQNG